MKSKNLALSTLSLALLCASSHLYAQAEERRYGQGAAFGADDLPPGIVRSQLEALPESARAQALNWLSSFTFPEQDLENIRIDNEGGVYYTETDLPAPVDSASTSGPAIEGINPADAFTLHSRPGASKVIYLDFDGETISGTAWNNSSGIGTYAAKAFSQDSDPNTFSDAERNAIAEIWHRIAEDFAIFDVDVTTERPLSFGPTTGHVLITEDFDKNGNAMPAQGAGGVAYVNVYTRSDYQYYSPAFVYSNRLGPNFAPFVAEAASHEMGHNLGLSHDGTSSLGYYSGHGSGATSWGPIMGTGYNDNVSQWSKGEYPDANNQQDDIAVMTADLGLRSDDHGNTFNTATALQVSNGVVSATTPENDPYNLDSANKGVINSTSDSDVFVLNAGAGTLALTFTPSWAAYPRSSGGRGTNLDIQVDLYDSNQSLIASFDDLSETSAVINMMVNAGTYYVAVSGVGNSDSPYSDYGSQGQYFITGSVPSTVEDNTPPLPDPMDWQSIPVAISESSITMTAVTATDDLGGPVQYYFDCTSGGTGCIDSGWISSTSYTANGLAPETNYTWQVKARDMSLNETGLSASASATTDAAPPAPLPPAAPTGVTASNNNDDTATVTWTDNADNESGFEILRETWHTKRKRWQSLTLIATPAENSTSYTDASGSGRYRYQVRAINSVGSSNYVISNEVDVTSGSGGGGSDGGGGGCKGGPKKCG